MQIKIAQRLRPFSHLPGTVCLLPYTPLRFRFFPTRIEVEDISSVIPKRVHVFDFQLRGPAQDFTVQQDLEKGSIRVWGRYMEGFVRYGVTPGSRSDSFRFDIEKSPKEGFYSPQIDRCLKKGDSIPVGCSDARILPRGTDKSRLSLGCHKSQDWDLVCRRLDMAEVLPFWHALGYCFPSASIPKREGNLKLLGAVEESIRLKRKLDLVPQLANAFQASFEGILSPTLVDSQHRGLGPVSLPYPFEGSPLAILSEGARIIRRLFLESDQSTLHVLPLLPPQFHCGRMLDVPLPSGTCSIEWTKKLLRRMVYKTQETQECLFVFQKDLKSFRLRTCPKEKGRRLATGEPLLLEQGRVYFFDNFMK